MDLVKVLKEAGVYDETMTEAEMKDYCQAINNSKDLSSTQKFEEESPDQNGTHVVELSHNKNSLENAPAKPKRITKKSFAKFKEPISITYQDLLDIPVKPLTFPSHECVFELPILRNPKYRHLPTEERVRLFEEQQQMVAEVAKEIARESLIATPWPPPHYASPDSGEKEGGDQPAPSVYVSRSGRQVKRPFYNEDEDHDFEPTLSNKMTRRSPSDEDLKVTFQELKVTSPPQTSSKSNKTPVGRKLSTRNRTEQIVMKALEADQKEKAEEEKRQASIYSFESEEEVDGFVPLDVVIDNQLNHQATTSGEYHPRRPIVQPIKSRRPIAPERLNEANLNLDEVTLIPIAKNREPSRRNWIETTLGSEKNQNRSKAEASVDCPLCSQSFPAGQVEAHAANCQYDPDSGPSSSNKTTSRILICDLCDMVCADADAFFIHHKECVNSR